MDLPKLNKRKQLSKVQQNGLALEIKKTIEKFQLDNNYEFEPYEVDNVFLNMVKRNHERYLKSKFGDDIEE